MLVIIALPMAVVNTFFRFFSEKGTGAGLFGVFFQKFSGHVDPHDRSHHQTSCPSAGITEAMESLDACVEVLIHFDAVAVELEFR